MTNKPRRRGTTWENACIAALRDASWPQAERRVSRGSNDCGDVAGVLDVTIECKSGARLDLAGWTAELRAEMQHDKTKVGFVWVKRVKKASAMDGYCIVPPDVLLNLLRQAGY